MSDLELERATHLLQQGRFTDCLAICASRVAREPRDALATHMLGLAIKETGDWRQGEQWLRLSIQLDPTRGEFHANLANLLRRTHKYRQAEKFYRQALQLSSGDRGALHGLGLTLLDLGRLPEAETVCRQLIAGDAADAQAWILLGLTLAGARRLAESESAYRQAIALEPGNPVAHHNLGAVLSQLEQPEAAFAALETARRLGSDSCELAFNRGRALLDLNDVAGAEREFDRAVTLQPGNVEAQLQLARVRYMLGDPRFARSLASAAAANRNDVRLQLLFAEVLWRAENLSGAEAVLRDLMRRELGGAHVQSTLAAVLHEGGLLKEAECFAMQAAAAAPQDAVIIEILVAVLLSRGRPDDAMPFIRTHRQLSPAAQSWVAYEATASRLLDQDRYRYLYDYHRLVRVFELEAPPGWSSMGELNGVLAQTLAERHRFVARPLDQTLRNGTQTSRSLLSDPHPAIRAILSAFAAPLEQYRRLLGNDAGHPLAARNSGNIRFTGAWSVRLQQRGFHVNHFHPDGWISSAYYVEVPPEASDMQARSGWIKFGEPRHPVPGTAAEHFVQPRPGRLVLFPAYMWH